MSVLAPSVVNLWKIIESYGVDPAPLFEAEDLEWQKPIPPGSRVAYEKVDRIRARAADLVADPAFGLRSAACIHPTQLGALGLAWLASSSLKTALLRLQRYVRVLNETGEIGLREAGEDLVVSVRVAQSSEHAHARDDVQMSTLLALCRMNVGPAFQPSWVSFRHAPPEDPGPYRALFHCPLKFDADENALAMPLTVVRQPLPTGDSALARMNERVVRQRLAKLDANNVPSRVRAAILEMLPSGGVTDESVAAALHMTSRTLHRRLKQECHSFRGLLKEVRSELAGYYIRDESLTLTEITFLLGFSEMSSFSRAFKQWNGVSPSVARKAAAAAT